MLLLCQIRSSSHQYIISISEAKCDYMEGCSYGRSVLTTGLPGLPDLIVLAIA